MEPAVAEPYGSAEALRAQPPPPHAAARVAAPMHLEDSEMIGYQKSGSIESLCRILAGKEHEHSSGSLGSAWCVGSLR